MTLIRACPKCKSTHLTKNGKLHARQKHECKACGYNFTVSKLGKSKPREVRRMALQLYLEGLSLRGIIQVELSDKTHPCYFIPAKRAKYAQS